MTGFSVKVLADSVAPGGERLTTVQATFPRFILAELNTHRLLSRNSASSRAIPTAKLLEQVRSNPVMPVYWGKNQSGMQAAERLTGSSQYKAEMVWVFARDSMLDAAHSLNSLGVHKQIANRVIEPWMWHTAIISGTECENFFAQRDTWPDPEQPPGPAQPEFAVLARLIREAMEESTPKQLKAGEWHLPLVETEDESSPLFIDTFQMVKDDGLPCDIEVVLCAISAARCARVSYLTHDGRRDLRADLDLHDRLVSMKHWSPLEHVAQAMPKWIPWTPDQIAVLERDIGDRAVEWILKGQESDRWSGNFRGWVQYRKLFAGEHAGHAPGDKP